MMNAAAILATSPRSSRFRYDHRDVILYALGIGAGKDPLDGGELLFVYEKNLSVIPTMSVTFVRELDALLADVGIGYDQYLYAGQRLETCLPLPVAAHVQSDIWYENIIDRGHGKGAFIEICCSIKDADSGIAYSKVGISLFCRDLNGRGISQNPESFSSQLVPQRKPDRELLIETRIDQPLLYRLSSGRNPLHIDPEVARLSGFERPIMHGHCTFGMICKAILTNFCQNNSSSILEISARFTAPVYPGDMILTRFWKDGSKLAFECYVKGRSIKVISHGICVLKS